MSHLIDYLKTVANFGTSVANELEQIYGSSVAQTVKQFIDIVYVVNFGQIPDDLTVNHIHKLLDEVAPVLGTTIKSLTVEYTDRQNLVVVFEQNAELYSLRIKLDGGLEATLSLSLDTAVVVI